MFARSCRFRFEIVHENESRGEPRARRRVEPLDEAQDRRRAAHVAEHLAKRVARHRENDGVGFVVRRVVECPAARHEHVVLACAEHAGKRRAPRARADDDDSHARFLKSIETGTPSRLNFSRIWFSTQ